MQNKNSLNLKDKLTFELWHSNLERGGRLEEALELAAQFGQTEAVVSSALKGGNYLQAIKYLEKQFGERRVFNIAQEYGLIERGLAHYFENRQLNEFQDLVQRIEKYDPGNWRVVFRTIKKTL